MKQNIKVILTGVQATGVSHKVHLIRGSFMAPATNFSESSFVRWPSSEEAVTATPTGVFLLRQYMLTIPDELIEAARMDHASEWRIYWRIVLPLSAPALAVLAIFSVMWRWNDFLLPLIVLSKSEFFTLQLALNSFQGELNTQWHYLLAMTVITLLPVTAVFAFLQRYITTGIASAGVK